MNALSCVQQILRACEWSGKLSLPKWLLNMRCKRCKRIHKIKVRERIPGRGNNAQRTPGKEGTIPRGIQDFSSNRSKQCNVRYSRTEKKMWFHIKQNKSLHVDWLEPNCKNTFNSFL